MPERHELDPRSSDDELLHGIGLLDPEPAPVVEPPADLWRRISAAAASDEEPDARPDAAPAADHAARPEPSTHLAPVVDLASRRRWPVLGAAAAAVVFIAAGAAVLLGSGDDPEPVSEVALDALVDDATGGSVELLLDGDTYTLRVDAEAVPADGEFLELWLIDGDVTEPRSLGRFTGAGDYEVPGDIDPEAFPIVDVSTEPDDGDDSHSGASVLRGALEL
ncbi:MAG: anti-sigma factor [Actinomycetota bacterium]